MKDVLAVVLLLSLDQQKAVEWMQDMSHHPLYLKPKEYILLEVLNSARFPPSTVC